MSSARPSVDGEGARPPLASANRTGGSTGRADIWTLIKQTKDVDKKSNPNETAVESTLLVVGSKQSGKSTVILRFLDRDEPPAPTVALEYTYGRRNRGVQGLKDVAHIWELAGGTGLLNLLDVPVTEANIHNVAFLITVDLSTPSQIVPMLEGFLGKMSARVKQILEKLEQKGSKRPQGLKAYAMKRYGSEHPDKNRVQPIPVPVIILGNKYDVFRDFEPEARKLMTKFLRYVAHLHGASLAFTSSKDENTIGKCRQLLNQHVFHTSTIKVFAFDHNKPIFITSGSDSFAQIGSPKAETDHVIGQPNVPTYDDWRKAMERTFPSGPVEDEKRVLVDLEKYAEPLIDSIWHQKRDELLRLRALNENKPSEDLSSLFVRINSANNSQDLNKKKGKARKRP